MIEKTHFVAHSGFGGRGGCPHPPEKIQRPCVGADTIRPPNRNQLLRLLAPGALSWSSRTTFPILPASGSGGEAESIGCTTRAGFEEGPSGSVPRNGGPGAGDWSACTPGSQSPAILWLLSHRGESNTNRKILPPHGGISLTSMSCRPFWGWISDQRGTCL